MLPLKVLETIISVHLSMPKQFTPTTKCDQPLLHIHPPLRCQARTNTISTYTIDTRSATTTKQYQYIKQLSLQQPSKRLQLHTKPELTTTTEKTTTTST